MPGTALENSRPLGSETSKHNGTLDTENTENPSSFEAGIYVDPEKCSLEVDVSNNTLSATQQDPNDSNIVTWDSLDDPENPLKYESLWNMSLVGDGFISCSLLKYLPDSIYVKSSRFRYF